VSGAELAPGQPGDERSDYLEVMLVTLRKVKREG